MPRVTKPNPTLSQDLHLEGLLSAYRSRRKPISVDFRRLVTWPSYPERATHLIHPYPAKLLAHIPFFFVASGGLSDPGDTILDPFCGSGTVLLEAVLGGRNAIGADANPLARLIARVKTHRYDVNNLRRESKAMIASIPSKTSLSPPTGIDVERWFYPHVTQQLLQILEGIRSRRVGPVRDFLEVCFSNCVRRLSLADPRLSVPVRLREDQYPKGHWLRSTTSRRLRSLRRANVIREFEQVVFANVSRVGDFVRHRPGEAVAQIVSSDARNLAPERSTNDRRRVQDESVRLILTSPPYGGAQKYIRASSLSIGWLGMCSSTSWKSLHDKTIGREHYPKTSYDEPHPAGVPAADRLLADVYSRNPLRAHIASSYLVEMKAALTECVRVLAPGGHIVLVTGNNTVCGMEFETTQYLRTILEDLGLRVKLELVDAIRSRGLMTRRNKTAGLISQEWVVVFCKS